MPRIPRVQRLQPLTLSLSSSSTPNRAPFAVGRAISTTCVARSSKNTEWVRSKLWRGEAPGPADPYTQRPETEDLSNLPQEAIEYQPLDDKTPGAVRASRLVLPPRRTEATPEQALKGSDPTYVPAENISELEEIPPLQEWWDQPGHWDEVSQYRGFGNPSKITEREVVEVYLRRAVVEVLALQETGKFQGLATKKWAEGSRAELEEALAVQVEIQDGKTSLKGDAASVADNLTSEVEVAGETETVTPEEATEMIKAWEPSWKDLVLDEQVKFALRKRLYQLTGNLISDAKLGAARTVKHVLTLATKPQRAQRLAETLEKRSDLHELPNVKIHSRKIGAIDKEVAVGRWKVIEEELRKRDLPVMGTGGLSRPMERDYLSSKR